MKIRDLMSRKIACLSAEDTVAGTPDMGLDDAVEKSRLEGFRLLKITVWQDLFH